MKKSRTKASTGKASTGKASTGKTTVPAQPADQPVAKVTAVPVPAARGDLTKPVALTTGVEIMLHKRPLFWATLLVVFVLLLWMLREVMLPFVAGTALAYFLNPLVTRMERLGISRVWATLAIIGITVLLIVLLLLLVIPLIGSQLAAFITRLPEYVGRLQNMLAQNDNAWFKQFLGDRLPDIQQSLSEIMTQGSAYLLGFLQSIWTGGQALISMFTLLVITPVVAFYMLNDWNRMVATVDSWVPVANRDTIRDLAREMDRAIAGFIRGQAAVCVILGSYYAIALSLSGLNFGFVIGFVSGMITFIPYVGSLTGLVLAAGVAVVQFFPDWVMILVIVGIFLAGQFVEGNILSPKLVGESAGLHPVWLMFALFAFGYLLGFVGLLLAVPLAAAVGVLARFGIRRYLSSTLYTGDDGSGSSGKRTA